MFSPPCRWSSHRVGGECCEATTACQHTSPLRHLWLILVTLRASSSQRHQRLPFQFRKASTQANKSKVKNTTLTHREHNSRHQGPQAGSFWRQLLIFTGTPAADSFGANLLPCCPPAALLTSPRALSPHTRAFSPTCFCIALCSSFSLLLFFCYCVDWFVMCSFPIHCLLIVLFVPAQHKHTTHHHCTQ